RTRTVYLLSARLVLARAREAELLEAVDEGAARYAEELGGKRLISRRALEGAHDARALLAAGPDRWGAPRPGVGPQLVDADRVLLAAEHECALHHRAELAHVPGPVVGEERLTRGGRERRPAAVRPAGRALDEAQGERHDLFGALAERRDRHRVAVEAEEQ